MATPNRPHRSRLCIAALLALSGCDIASPPAPPTLSGGTDSTETVAVTPGFGLNLPRTIDGFVRVDTEDRSHGNDIVAGYARSIDPSPIMATIRLHRTVSDTLEPLVADAATSTVQRSNAALDASIAQVRHYYPALSVGPRRDVFLIRFGSIQTGRAVTLTYTDLMAGIRQPIRVEIDTFCCEQNRWDYEYRFRSPASLDARQAIAGFLAHTPWSADPTASVDRPS